MARYEFNPGSGYVAGARYRIDTASGSDSAATIEHLYTPGLTISGAILVADELGVLPSFAGSAATLYAKRLTSAGSPTGDPTTLTGVLLDVPAPDNTRQANDARYLTTAAAAGLSSMRTGQATLVSGTVTVSATWVTAKTRFMLTRFSSGGTVGHLTVGTVTAGTSFVISSSSASETSVVTYVAFETP